MAKVFTIDLNLDTKDVLVDLLYAQISEDEKTEYQKEVNEWAKKPEATRGDRPTFDRTKMSGAEFFKDIVMKAISMVHKTGNTASLRRTKSIGDLIDHAIEKKSGILELMDEDYKYIKKAVSKADEWMNIEAIARAVQLVEDTILAAENEDEVEVE